MLHETLGIVSDPTIRKLLGIKSAPVPVEVKKLLPRDFVISIAGKIFHDFFYDAEPDDLLEYVGSMIRTWAKSGDRYAKDCYEDFVIVEAAASACGVNMNWIGTIILYDYCLTNATTVDKVLWGKVKETANLISPIFQHPDYTDDYDGILEKFSLLAMI